jgi:hypothetical protein
VAIHSPMWTLSERRIVVWLTSAGQGNVVWRRAVLCCKRTYQTFRKDNMTDETADTSRRPRPELSAAQVTGGALAAVTSALAGSTLGVNGTVAGAAVGSVVATVGGELYTQSLRRTHQTVRGVVARAPGAQRAENMPGTPASDQKAPATGLSPAATTHLPPVSEPPAHGGDTRILGPGARQPAAVDRSPVRRWALLSAAAAGVFALSMGVLSVAEVLAGRPVASVVSGEPGSGTTLGTSLRGPTSAQVTEPNPTDAPSVGESGQPTSETTPTSQSSEEPARRSATPAQSDSQTPTPRSSSSATPTPSSATP